MIRLILPTGQRISKSVHRHVIWSREMLPYPSPHPLWPPAEYFIQLFTWSLGKKSQWSVIQDWPWQSDFQALSWPEAFSVVFVFTHWESLPETAGVDGLCPYWRESQWEEVFLSSASKRGSDVGVHIPIIIRLSSLTANSEDWWEKKPPSDKSVGCVGL